eukprot:1026427-Rhodomonas_salina.1
MAGTILAKSCALKASRPLRRASASTGSPSRQFSTEHLYRAPTKTDGGLHMLPQYQVPRTQTARFHLLPRRQIAGSA